MLYIARTRCLSSSMFKICGISPTTSRVYTTKPLKMLNPKLYDPIPVNGSGFVRLVDHMPHTISAPLYCDAAIPEMARISYGGVSEDGAKPKTQSSDEALIRYLMRNYHTSPFEAVEFKFHLKIPIFVERQLIRHRTASVNQISGRYSVLPDDYYVPKKIRKQSLNNKQGSQGVLDEDDLAERTLAVSFREKCRNNFGHKQYQTLIKHHNVAKEMARITLPQNIMTELYWKIDLHNLLHFLHLRQDKHAQEEIRDVANILFSIVKEMCPVSTQAFLDYRVNAVTFTACEIQAIQEKDLTCIPTKREKQEFKDKSKILRLDWLEK